jgi:hypothetical protein
MSGWRSVARLLRMMAEVWRFNPDPTAAPDPRAERLAAGGIGVLVLGGAIGTYLVVVGGLSPLLADVPAGGRPASTPATSSVGPEPSPSGPAAEATAAAPATPEPTPTPTVRPTRRAAPTTTPPGPPPPPPAPPATTAPVTTQPPVTTPPPTTEPPQPEPG